MAAARGLTSWPPWMPRLPQTRSGSSPPFPPQPMASRQPSKGSTKHKRGTVSPALVLRAPNGISPTRRLISHPPPDGSNDCRLTICRSIRQGLIPPGDGICRSGQYWWPEIRPAKKVHHFAANLAGIVRIGITSFAWHKGYRDLAKPASQEIGLGQDFDQGKGAVGLNGNPEKNLASAKAKGALGITHADPENPASQKSAAKPGPTRPAIPRLRTHADKHAHRKAV